MALSEQVQQEFQTRFGREARASDIKTFNEIAAEISNRPQNVPQAAPTQAPQVREQAPQVQQAPKVQQAPQTTKPETPALTGEVLSPREQQLQQNFQAQQQIVESYVRELDAFRERQDEITNGLIKGIQDSYAQRIEETKVLNEALMGSQRKAGFRSGRARYAPEIQAGILAEEEKQGLRRIKDLENERNSLIFQAQNAAAERDFKLLNQKMGALSELNEQKRQMVLEQHKMAMDYENQSRQRAEFEMKKQEFAFQIEDRVIKQEQAAASSLAMGLVDLDANFNVVEPTFAEIQSIAEEAGLDPIVLSAEVNKRIDEVMKVSREERGFYFDQKMEEARLSVQEQSMELQRQKFNFDVYQFEFQREVKLEELEMDRMSLQLKLQELQNDGFALSGDQLKDAVSKGYKTDAELKLYARQIESGVEPSALKEKSAEQKKLEGNVLSGLSSVSILRKKVTESVGRGKLFDKTYKFAEDNLKDIIGRLRSGGAITEDEQKTFLEFLPGFWESDETRLTKLNELENQLINTIGMDGLQSAKNEVYADVKSFNKFATIEEKDEFDQFLSHIGASPNGDISEYFDIFREEKGFSGPLSMGENGSNVTKIASAIGQYESGGNYKARGPVVKSGQYKGERALGRYQIMPGNLPQWSREALGREVSAEEFLNNPQIQDQIAQHQMNKIYNKYGTVEDVASVWFSGKPLAKAGNAKDVLGTSVPQYVKNIRSIYNKLS